MMQKRKLDVWLVVDRLAVYYLFVVRYLMVMIIELWQVTTQFIVLFSINEISSLLVLLTHSFPYA